MTRPAMTSPFTNFIAPSIAPNICDSRSRFAAALARLRLVDGAGAQVGVDGHLLARHRVQGEARRDLRHALGALGDHQELHQRQDREDHRADDVVAPDDELAEGLDDLARVSLREREPRRRHVQRQPEQRRHQQQRRERASPSARPVA